MVAERSDTDNLDLSFQTLMVGDESITDGMCMGYGWKDLPVDILLHITSLMDDYAIIEASGVCIGWRDIICNGVTHLSLSWCKENMNDIVLSIAPKFTKLQSLTLRQSKAQLQDNAVEAIASSCHDLTELDLSGSYKLNDRSLFELSSGCPNLTKLNLSGCSKLTEHGLSCLSSFKHLKWLNLCGCVSATTDKALDMISRGCHKLQFLNLGWCESVSDAGVINLTMGCQDLRSLDLCGCVLITDESVTTLAHRCLHLKSLGLYYCQNITDDAMYSLAFRDRRRDIKPGEGLVNLNISQCTALTPDAVQAVCNSYPELHTCPSRHSLIMSGCLSLTSVHCACGFQTHQTPINNHLY